MITDFLLDLLEGIVTWFAGLLPVDDSVSGEGLGFQVFAGANYFFPLAELSSVVLGILALGLPLGGVSLIIWLVVGVIRGGQAKA